MEIRIVSPEDAAEIGRMANRIDTTSLQTARTFGALLERGAPDGTERLATARSPPGRRRGVQLGFEASVVVEDYARTLRAETSSSPEPRAPAT